MRLVSPNSPAAASARTPRSRLFSGPGGRPSRMLHTGAAPGGALPGETNTQPHISISHRAHCRGKADTCACLPAAGSRSAGVNRGGRRSSRRQKNRASVGLLCRWSRGDLGRGALAFFQGVFYSPIFDTHGKGIQYVSGKTTNQKTNKQHQKLRVFLLCGPGPVAQPRRPAPLALVALAPSPSALVAPALVVPAPSRGLGGMSCRSIGCFCASGGCAPAPLHNNRGWENDWGLVSPLGSTVPACFVDLPPCFVDLPRLFRRPSPLVSSTPALSRGLSVPT